MTRGHAYCSAERRAERAHPSELAEDAEGAAARKRGSLRAVSDAIESGSTQAINYFIAQKYVEAIGKFATSPNAKTILFPVEATQLMGTLGGIGELAREAIGGSGPKPPAPSTPAPRTRPTPFGTQEG